MVELKPIKVDNLDIFENPCDLRRDLLVFIDYVQERQVKRLHRTNGLSKPDGLRLAKLMSDPEAVAEVREHGAASWVDYVDEVALFLDLVSYDIKGVYAGYSSVEPSFPDNYIIVNEQKFQRYLHLSLADQEQLLLNTLLKGYDGCGSEFFRTGILGQLDRFSSFGCGTGVVPGLDFQKIRRFLLDLLQTCPDGVWYSTASLVQYLKTNQPYFLIPQDYQHLIKRPGRREGRYSNFSESKDGWGHGDEVSEQDPDAFERVEGRYVERFLEDLPLILGYVDVAYHPQPYQGLYPSRQMLQAFRLSNRLKQALTGRIPAPKVTVQPNFEIYVESEFYPAGVLAQLTPLAELVSEDTLTILKLQKEKVAAQLALDETLDVVSLLTQLSDRALPGNVVRELREWVEHSEKFILYEGFGLLEGDAPLSLVDPFTVETISSKLRIIHSPQTLFSQLEAAEMVPLRVSHAASAFSQMPAQARTVFVKKSKQPKPKPKKKETVNLLRQVSIILHFPEVKILQTFRKALLDARCPVVVDEDNLTLTYAQSYQAQVTAVMKNLAKQYNIHFQDID